ncbi:MAG TPA: CapA family protein, partial [Solirubrobacteraceae bacterium]|nr:CapA family protein [Solirubrobacteraceae bacterium]
VYGRALANGAGERYDFRPMFAEIRPVVERADLAVCHAETPMAEGPPSGYPRFNTPRALAGAIERTGWDACTTASNHALDQGEAGIAQTHRALERAGLRHTGTATSRADGDKPLIIDVQGVKVALLAYTESTNGLRVPDPWAVNLMDADAILEDARAARRAGAQAVLVNLHAGTEYAHEPSQAQRRVVRRLTRSRAVTAVIGQHVHVVQPIERVNGKVVVYGEGNLISNQTPACCAPGAQDGLIALLVLTVRGGGHVRVERVRYVPVHVRHPDFAVLPVGEALEDGEGDPAALRASYERTVEVVGRGEGISPLPAGLP